MKQMRWIRPVVLIAALGAGVACAETSVSLRVAADVGLSSYVGQQRASNSTGPTTPPGLAAQELQDSRDQVASR